ncbi:hypothetical protein HA466_0190790 [Hirschfeldia incana]|nr:hypothetical protein HA466_0190790 [Hirschfeldia incana]
MLPKDDVVAYILHYIADEEKIVIEDENNQGTRDERERENLLVSLRFEISHRSPKRRDGRLRNEEEDHVYSDPVASSSLYLVFLTSSGEAVNSSENVGVCVSKGGRSHHQPYELEGKLPESADLEFKDLNLCNVFHEKTCCSASRLLSASLALQNLATHGEASNDCLFWFELLECSICHPDVGVQTRPLRICASFCDSVFEACSDAYFSTSDASNQVILPCGTSNDTICEKASYLETNGTAFCEAVGFTVVQTSVDSAEEPCYGSKSILVTVVPVVESLVKTDEMERAMRRLRRRNRNRRRF